MSPITDAGSTLTEEAKDILISLGVSAHLLSVTPFPVESETKRQEIKPQVIREFNILQKS